MSMIYFSRQEIVEFLKTVDSFLTQPFEVEIIGGAAGALAFRVKSDTVDIDTITSVEGIEDTLQVARQATGLNIPVGTAGVWDGPYHYRSRRKRVRARSFKRLRLYVPDINDWVLMKIVRYRDRDKKHLEEAHKAVGFNKRTLFRRFLGDMSSVVNARPEDLVFNFLSMISTFYGAKEARRMLKVIRKHKKWKDRLIVEFNPFLGGLGNPEEPEYNSW